MRQPSRGRGGADEDLEKEEDDPSVTFQDIDPHGGALVQAFREFSKTLASG